MTLRKFTLFAAVIAACLAPTLAKAAIGTGSYIVIDRSSSGTSSAGYLGTDPTYGGSGGGGEFRVSEATSSGALISGGEVFKTFCLEYNEHITAPGTYNVTINDSAYFGGVGIGSTTGSPRHDKLGEITVMLYSAYRNNALDDINLPVTVGNPSGADFAYDTTIWADALQWAIWRSENEFTSTYGGLISGTLKDYADALYDYAAANLPLVQDSNVKVLNLWAGTPYVSGNERQSQLYYGTAAIEVEGVPEPASLVIWGAGLGIAGFVAARRRKMAKAA